MVKLRSSGCLNKANVGAILNAASFSIQAFKKPMNVSLAIVGDLTVKRHASRFIHALEQRIGDWTSHKGELPWVVVYRKQENGNFAAAVGLHVEPAFLDRFERWSSRYRERAMSEVEMQFGLPLNGSRPERRHQQVLATILQSTDHDINVRVAGAVRRLVDIVSPNVSQKANYVPFEGRCFEIARCIGRRAQQAAQADGMGAIFAFDEKAFDFLNSGWEFQEYEDRRREHAHHQRQSLIIRSAWPEGVSKLFDAKRAHELKALRDQTPRDRYRSWTPWWAKSHENAG